MSLRSIVALLVCWTMLLLHPAWAQDAVAKPACALCTDHTVECPTCAGKGTKAVPCGVCLADGKVECGVCAGERPGTVDCPNPYCRDGKSHWDGGDADPCRLCATKGRIPCPICRGRKPMACAACAGTGKSERTCPTCLGGKRVPCPLCTVDPARMGCSTCDGGGRVVCQLCPAGTNKSTEPCLHCMGVGDHHCFLCSGLGRVSCESCAATGKMRMASPTSRFPGAPTEKAGVKQCDSCEGKATIVCKDCKKGRIDCKHCEKGRIARTCVHCLHQRVFGCDECLSGGYSRWEVLGELLLAKAQPARAALFFDRALTTAKTMTGPPRLVEGYLQLLIMQSDLEYEEEALKSPAAFVRLATSRVKPPSAVTINLEVYWPADARRRHWPDPPPRQEHAPWTNEGWMKAHRARVVARLENSLAKARAAAGK